MLNVSVVKKYLKVLTQRLIGYVKSVKLEKAGKNNGNRKIKV